jgi:DMSO/TMAO reductase YedYZ molybdopterin-dependent catalytic subunit
MADIRSLPKVELITELKCIEGWSRILKWGGARFQDFVRQYAPGQSNPNSYVALETPGREYYVGLDMASAIHPQTLLCYEMNGKPLESQHGAPLRLVIPVKYGIKNLKRIGKIIFSETRPPDYWAERGYDYYAGF